MKMRDDYKKGRRRSSSRNSKVKLILLAPPKRGGGGGPTAETATSTPILPWKSTEQLNPFSSLFPPPIPARKIAAAVWEFTQYLSPPEDMQFGGDREGLRLRLHQNRQHRRRDHHQHYLHHHRRLPEMGNVGFDDEVELGGPSHRSPEPQPATASSLRRQVAALLAQHHRTSERKHPPPQPRSPASYGSSLEINAYNQAFTPTSSIELKGRIGEPSYGFKTSTELLKVLNRIWTLEEQHASNVSLVKAMKTELNQARTRIKELLRDQQASRHEIDELMKQVAEDKPSRKSKDLATIESLRGELEAERKLRKRSEGLHRRLAREIFEVKVGLSTSLKELERERTGRCLLEELCDEFAHGILEYEREAHLIRPKIGTDGDRLMVNMCESWLDERIQMRDQQQAQGNLVVDKIRDEIENFLEARKMVASKEDAKDWRRLRRNSLESFPLNDAGSAPRYTGNEDSTVSTSRLFEIKHEDGVGKDPTNTRNEPAVDQEKAVSEMREVDQPREGKGGINKLVSELLMSEGGRKDGNTASRRKATIVSPGNREITNAVSLDHEMSESTSKNTLKAKLQEPKARVGYRSRLKILKGSS